ncbi:hypothetical protein QQG55_10145 [Brugia pahangi]
MALIILPLYIYLIIRRSNIQIKIATNIKYTLLDFKKIQPGVKLKGWQEISNGTKSYISIKDGEKHIAKVYRPSISESDTSSKTASIASLHTMKSSHSSRSAKSVSMSPIVSGSNT